MSDVETMIERIDALVSRYYHHADEETRAVITNLTGIHRLMADLIVAQAREREHWAAEARDALVQRDLAVEAFGRADDENARAERDRAGVRGAPVRGVVMTDIVERAESAKHSMFESVQLVPELVAEVERLRAELLAERMSESRALAECRSELAEMTLSRAELGDEVQKLRHWRDGDRGRAELSELRATVGRIREALAGHPKCDVHPDDGVTCGWKKAVASVQWALNAEADR